MKKYIGVKEIQAVEAEQHTCTNKDCAEGIEGYKVIYTQSNGNNYESWSPKDEFEKAYCEVDIDKKKMRELFCQLVSETNKQEGVFLPQAYLWTLLNKMEEQKFTYNKAK